MTLFLYLLFFQSRGFCFECRYIQTALSLSGVHFDASVFRILRLFRILQLEHFVSAFTLLDDVWNSCKATLAATGLLALVLWIGSACLFYLFEKVCSVTYFPAMYLWCFQLRTDLHWSKCMSRPSIHQVAGNIGRRKDVYCISNCPTLNNFLKRDWCLFLHVLSIVRRFRGYIPVPAGF